MGDLLYGLLFLLLIPVGLVALDWFSREAVPGSRNSIPIGFGRRQLIANRWLASLMLTSIAATLIAFAWIYLSDQRLDAFGAIVWGLAGGLVLTLAARNHAAALQRVRHATRQSYSSLDEKRSRKRPT